MTISLRDIMDGSTESVRNQASNNNLPYVPFTTRELITPQYKPKETSLGSSKKNWENWVGQHDEKGKRMEYRPTSRKQLIAAVVGKAHSRGKVRAVGSGHSHSNAPEPADSYIELDPGEPKDSKSTGLNEVLDQSSTSPGGPKTWLKSNSNLPGGLDRAHLKRLESGIVLRRLNRHILHPDGLALKNMGSFDGQTIAGAVNTSTHGTGVGLKSISDSVKSVEIATVPESESGDPIVRLYRIERDPPEAITDREKFERDTGEHEMELIQDSDLFHSVVVGYGCMGVVYAYTMEVVPNYWLREENELMAWNDLESKLKDKNGNVTEGSVKSFLTKRNTRHCQIFLNTAAEQVPDQDRRLRQHKAHGVGKHEDHQNPVCQVKRFIPTKVPRKTKKGTSKPPANWVNPTKDQRWPPERRARPFRDAGKALSGYHPLNKYPGRAKFMHNNFFHPAINKDPFVGGKHETVWYVALRRLRDRGDEKTSEYYHPPPPGPPTPTTEIGVPLDKVVTAVNTVRKKVRNVTQGDQIKTKKSGRTSDGKGLPVFFPVPMGIRFTAASEHFLSPEYAEDGHATAMIELPLPLFEPGGTAEAGSRPNPIPLNFDQMRKWVVLPALTKVHDELVFNEPYTARPHMGKHNTIGDPWLRANYDKYDPSDGTTGWLDAYNRFNHFGTFDNKFTKQLGIDNS